MKRVATTRPLNRVSIILLLVLINIVVVSNTLPIQAYNWLGERISVFATVFLGIFIEAVPFLLLGTLVSGIVEVFIGQERIKQYAPKGAFRGAMVGAAMGFMFPVCECGVVPLARRLFRKGLPIPAGVAFLLAAPVLSPIVVLSTGAAFGWGRLLALRMVLTLIIAVGFDSGEVGNFLGSTNDDRDYGYATPAWSPTGDRVAVGIRAAEDNPAH